MNLHGYNTPTPRVEDFGIHTTLFFRRQHWKILEKGKKKVRLKNIRTGKVIDVDNHTPIR